MKQKRIAIIAPHLIAAGVETSLINLLKELVKRDINVTLLLVRENGAFLDRVPGAVSVREIAMSSEAREQLFRGGFLASLHFYVKNFRFVSFIKLAANRLIWHKEVPELLAGFETIPREKTEFDIAVAYHIHMPFIVQYVEEKITAKKKIAFMHNDLKVSHLNIQSMRSSLIAFSRIFAVSEGLAKELKNAIPEMASRISVFLNICDSEEIIQKAQDIDSPFDGYGGKRLLTIARLEDQKGIDIAIEAFSRCVSKKNGAKWFVIGSGSLEKKLKQKAKKMGVDREFIFLGVKDNPYPYLQDCDVYIQPSRHEGLCVSVQEAKLLRKTIIVTDVVGLRELIEDGKTGMVVKCDSESIARGIDQVFSNDSHVESYKKNLTLNASIEDVDDRIECLLRDEA